MKKYKSYLSIGLVLILSIATMLILSSCEPQIQYYGDDPDVSDEGDSYEPDNNYNDATTLTLNNAQPHTINVEGDLDWFKFTAEKDKTYRINMFSIAGFEPEMSLFKSDHITLVEMKNTGTYTDTYDWWGYDKDRNYVEEEKESIIFVAPYSGTFYVKINDVYFAHRKGSYNIKVHNIITVGVSQNLVASPNQNGFGINVTWSEIPAVDGYYLFRSTIYDPANVNWGNFLKIKTLPSTTKTYLDTNITPNTTYYYVVKGYIQTVMGDPSNVDDAVFEFTSTTALTAHPNPSDFQIDVTWDQMSGVDGYKLYRATIYDANSPDWTKFQLVKTLNGSTSLTYSDTNIAPNTAYYYYVAGYIGNYEGAKSNVDDAMFEWTSFKPKSSLINASEGLSAKIDVKLIEKYNNSNIVKYEVFKTLSQTVTPTDTDKIGEFAGNVALDNTNNVIHDTNVVAGTYYFYCVRIIININGTDTASNYSWYDSGVSN